MKKFKIEIYSATVRFFTEIDEFNKFIDCMDNEHEFVTYSDGSDVCILVSDIFGCPSDSKFLQCLSHECNHAAMAILESTGFNLDYNNQEPLCYLQDHIFKRIYEYCLKLKG